MTIDSSQQQTLQLDLTDPPLWLQRRSFSHTENLVTLKSRSRETLTPVRPEI